MSIATHEAGRDHVDSHYARTRTADPAREPLSGEVETETCVVGGGLAGLTTAIALAERGRDVVLLEERRVGWGASGRNGGFVGAGFSRPVEDLTARLGREHADELYRLSAGGVDRVRELIARHDIDCDPVFEGTLRVSRVPDREALERSRDHMARRFGEQHELWTRERVRESVLSDRYHEALFSPEGFQIHPLNYAGGVAAAAQAAGARIFESSAVTGVRPAGAGSLVTGEQGTVRARHVVFACGGYLERLVPRLARAIVPVATYVITTEPLGHERLMSAIRIGAGISDGRLANDYYRPLADTRILWGGRISVRRSRPPDLAGSMLGDLLSVYPQLRGVRVDTAWHGLMSYAAHKMPQVGQLREGVWYAMGFGGHGLNTTAMAGDLVAGAIADGDDRYRLLAPFGLVPTGGPIGAAAAQLTYWYYQLRDRVRER